MLDHPQKPFKRISNSLFVKPDLAHLLEKQPQKLFNRNFYLLWQGQAVSKLGAQVYSMAMILWIVEKTGSATLMGMLAMLSAIPATLLGPLGGTFADRYSRRTIIILSDLFKGLLVLALAMFVISFPDQIRTTLVLIFIVSVLTAVVNAFFFPAISAAIPDIVPAKSLTKANTLGQLSTQFATLIGQGLGGLFYKLLGAPVLFLINSIGYLFSAGCESFIQIPQKVSTKRYHWKENLQIFKTDTVEGFRFIAHTVGLREMLTISIVIAFFTTPIFILLPFFIKDFLNLGENWQNWVGYLIAIDGIGALIGYIAAGLLRIPARLRGRLLMIFIILSDGLFVFLGLTRSVHTVAILAFLSGLFQGFAMVYITTILQVTTPADIRGRVFGLLNTLTGAITPIAMGLAGVVADLVDQNIPAIFIACGLISMIWASIFAFNANYRNYLAIDYTEQVAQEESQKTPSSASET